MLNNPFDDILPRNAEINQKKAEEEKKKAANTKKKSKGILL